MPEVYGTLTTEQQGKLMRQIGELERIDGDVVELREKEIRNFIDYLVYFSFITPAMRVKYLGGIQDAMERRQMREKQNDDYRF
jgi:hypothetical protein